MTEADIIVGRLLETTEETDKGSGIFVDFSAGRDKPVFTCKCPKCRTIHGQFRDLASAKAAQICKRCHFKSVEKLKKEVEKVDDPKKEKSIFEGDAEDELDVKEFILPPEMPSITKLDCLSARYGQEFYHKTKINADGSPMRVKVTGRCQTWKTRPNEFRLPVKYGYYEQGEITHWKADEWTPIRPPDQPRPKRRR